MRGTCWVLPTGHAPREMPAGDVFLLGPVDYAVESSPDATCIDGAQLYQAPARDSARLGGDDVVLLGGGIAFADDRAHFLLDALPRFMNVDRSSPSASAVAGILHLLDREVGRSLLGGSLVASRLAEILLVEALRAYVTDHGATDGWLGALGDPAAGEALRLMHAAVGHRWTVGELAKRVGMSRSAFALRFKERVGRAPLEYLAHWRLTLARRLLREGRATVGTVAAEVGYASQSAFGTAFRRAFGHSPGSSTK